MLFMYVLGLLSMRVKSTVVLASICAVLVLATGLLFGAEFQRAGAGALIYFLLGLPWFWLLQKTNDTIFMWFVVLIPGPYAIFLAATAADVAMFGRMAA